MPRYLFSYSIISTDEKKECSFFASENEDPHVVAQERIADLELTVPEDIKVGELIQKLETKDHYYECDGCT